MEPGSTSCYATRCGPRGLTQNHSMTNRLAAALLLCLLGIAHGEDERIAGSRLVLKQGDGGEHLVLVAREGIVAPLPGGEEDPTIVGAVLEISNPRTGEWARFETAAQDWSINAVGTVFRFRNSHTKGPGSEVRALVIKHRRRLKISTRALGISLDEETQRAVSVVLATGTRRYCLLFGGTIGKDKPGRFVARNAPAPSACPALVVGSSTTSTTSGTQPSTSTTKAPTIPTTTSSTRPPTTTSSSAPPPTTSTSTSSSTTQPQQGSTTTSLAPPPTTSTSEPPPTTSSTSSSTSSSSSTVPTSSTTTSTAKPCSFRGNACKGSCSLGLRCVTLDFGLRTCACLPL